MPWSSSVACLCTCATSASVDWRRLSRLWQRPWKNRARAWSRTSTLILACAWTRACCVTAFAFRRAVLRTCDATSRPVFRLDWRCASPRSPSPCLPSPSSPPPSPRKAHRIATQPAQTRRESGARRDAAAPNQHAAAKRARGGSMLGLAVRRAYASRLSIAVCPAAVKGAATTHFWDDMRHNVQPYARKSTHNLHGSSHFTGSQCA